MYTAPEQEDEPAAVETRASPRFLMESHSADHYEVREGLHVTLNEKNYSGPVGFFFLILLI